MNLLLKIIIFGCCALTTSTIMAMRTGGISEKEHESTDEVQEMVSTLGSEIKSAAFAAYSGSDSECDNLKDHFQAANLTAIGHKTQIVAGVNYFIRTKIGDYIFHVRIYRDLKKHASVAKVVGPKKETDPIEYF